MVFSSALFCRSVYLSTVARRWLRLEDLESARSQDFTDKAQAQWVGVVTDLLLAD